MTQPTTQAEYFQANAVDGELTAAQMMELVQLPEGDIALASTASANGSVPAAASDAQTQEPTDTQSNTTATAPTDAQAQVILAKDGVHTIPFEKLVEAREEGKHWKAQAQAAQDALAALQAQADARAEAGKAATATDKAVEAASAAIEAGADPDLFGDFSEEAIRAGVKKLVAEQAASLRESIRAELQQELAPIKQAKQVDEAEQARNLVLSKHPDAASIAESAELEQWVQSKPAFVRGAYQQVITGGTPAQVVELLDAFKAETKPATANAGAEAAAAKAIANAKTRSPSSLSDIPGGVAASTNPAEGLADASAQDLISKFEGLSEKARWELIEKIS